MDSPSFPYSKEAEVWILSSILLAGSGLMDEIAPRLTVDHFWERNHRIVWSACQTLHGGGNPVDCVAVCSKLRDSKLLEEVGGEYYVTQLAVSAPTSAHADYWLEVLEQKYTLRKSLELASWIQRQAGNIDDIDAFVSELETKTLALKEFKDSDNLTAAAAQAALDRNQKLLDGVKTFGIASGIHAIDYPIGGLCAGQQIYVCARPGKGKTALIEQICFNLLMEDKAITVFEKDMAVETFLERMACRAAKVSYSAYRKGFCDKEGKMMVRYELQKLQRAANRLILRSPTRLTGSDVISMVRRDKLKSGIEAVFLDHVQLLDCKDDFREGLTRASMDLKRSAQESGLPHVIIAQLNRNADNGGRPKASDVKEFDQAFADADAMILLWSEIDPATLAAGAYLPVKFAIAKNRNGPLSEEEMLFDGTLMEFKQLTKKI
jgi:replicative DNA helicase